MTSTKQVFLFLVLVIFSCSPNIQDSNNPHPDENSANSNEFQQWSKNDSCPAGIDAMTSKKVAGVTCRSEIQSEWKKIHIKAPDYVNQTRWVRFPDVINEKILLVPKDEEIIKQGAWKNPKAPRLIFLQLDGMTEKLIEQGIAAGELPAMKFLTESGASGLIESCCSLNSPSIWTTVLTGLDPAKHGIRDFLYKDENSGQTLVNNSTEVKAPRLWEIAKAFGKKHLVCNAYYAGPEDNQCANAIVQASNARLIRELTLKENPELLIVYETEADYNSHLWWITAEPEELIRNGWKASRKFIDFHSDHIRQSYRELDAWVAFALSIAGPKTIILAHSDHGLQPTKDPPEWSINLGALMKAMSFPGMFECGQSDLESVRFCYKEQTDQQQFIDVCKNAKLSKGQKPFTSVISTAKKNGHPGFVQVKYDSAILSEGIEKDGELKFDGRSVPVRKFFMASNSGIHTNFGVVYIAGKGIKKGSRFSNASVFDSMPNALSILGLPIAEEMTGRIWDEVYETAPKARKIKSYGRLEKQKKYELPSTEQLDALRSLGYIQ